MMDDRTGIKAVKVCGGFVFTLLFALLLSVHFDFYYDLNDDTMIKDILSGAYTGNPSGFCIQMLYPLGWCIALLYRAIPTVPWYGLFLCLCQFGVFFLIAVRILFIVQRARARIVALAAEVVVAFGFFLREFVIIQYSVTAGICMVGAVFLFLTAPKTDKPSVFFRINVLPLVLVVLSFMIRTEVCIMLLPFLLFSGIVKWCGEDKIFTTVNFRKYMMLIVVAFLCMTAVYSLDVVAYSGSEWSNFRNFFDARTKLYDFYGLPTYENNKDFYEAIGLSRESYTLLENYNFALDESIDTWRLEAIVSYQEQLAKEGRGLHSTFGFVSRNSVKDALWKYKTQMLNDMSFINIALIGLYLLYVCVCVVSARGKARVAAVLKMLCLIAVRSILWLYLCMVDRLLDRVTVPLLMMELIVVIGLLICDSQWRDKIRTFVFALCFICAVAVSISSIMNVQSEYNGRAAADARWNAMMDYCRKNGNNYYVIDVYSSTSYQGVSYSEKIFTDVNDSYKNFDICGGWMAKSPLARKKIEKYHFRDIQNALSSSQKEGQARAYFVADANKNLDWLIQYYKKRGIVIELKCIDQIQTVSKEPAFDVYELVRR